MVAQNLLVSSQVFVYQDLPEMWFCFTFLTNSSEWPGISDKPLSDPPFLCARHCAKNCSLVVSFGFVFTVTLRGQHR